MRQLICATLLLVLSACSSDPRDTPCCSCEYPWGDCQESKASILSWIISPAAAQDLYSHADLGEYYRSLMQPDNPNVSCCGDGDAYYADKVEPCTILDGPACVLVAIITDTRSNKITRPDGSVIHRMPVEPGTRVAVPRHKIRRSPIPNPTGHSIVFLSSLRGVMCWEPQGGM